MPFFSETPNTVKTRSGIHDPPESARATPSISKSICRENLLQSSTVRNFNEREDFRDAANTGLAVRSFELPEDPSFWKDHNVQVIIRLRPLNSSEISLQGNNRCVRQESCQTITWTGHPESRFTFDLVADENVTQEKLFKVAGVPMVENCVGGYNSCMFAYGQTGSGKTHTMLGDIEGGTRRHSVNCGMTPRVFEYLFSRIQKEKEARREEKLRFTCKCSFLEIYNEQILDLLNPSFIREDLKKGVHVENLTEIEVTSAREVMQQLLEGAANRKVAATNMNRASSRSHSVFTCVIESTWESQGVTHHRFARLHLVDLAGSERQKSSGAEGERLKEATNINKSLSTLGLVIMNLVSISNGKSLHVPYRDSKLTFLLQDSLGGNSKTTIIANISPSTCSSLETLSTLKFAQRAKFIKNNAIINEDASGDVLAMRMQIQQLKKEVSHLRGLLNEGAGNQGSDTLPLELLGSPGPFKWEGLNGTSSPLTFDKRLSQKKEYEVALVAALRREKEKDMALQALTAETQAAMQLAKQREDEIQGLKMRLRFREAGIKRLEAVASGKISAETHLLKEKEEHLKEIEVLRAQVDRNQEVTRFAMENLRLKEEIRRHLVHLTMAQFHCRLKSFCEEGEMERMSEQIMTLQNKLLEALDWKLMHESGPSSVQKSPGLLTDSDLDQLNPDKASASPWQSAIKEENEFLRLQAIQNQAEVNSLRKKLNSCVEEKASLERCLKDLETELEGVRSSKDAKGETQEKLQINISTATSDINNISLNDQLELKAMVDAIAAASQREAEAHEMAITLAKENDELRAKIKVLIDDNNKLIDLYERAVAEVNNKVNELDSQDQNNEARSTGFDVLSESKGPDVKKVEDLELQLLEMHEENEKLMNLYEKAMQERDDFKKMLASSMLNKVTDKGQSECPEKLVEVDEGDNCQHCDPLVDENSHAEIDKPTVSTEAEVFEDNDPSTEASSIINSSSEASVQPRDEIQVLENPNLCDFDPAVEEKNALEMGIGDQDTPCQHAGGFQDERDTLANVTQCPQSVMEEKLVMVRKELCEARERLSYSSQIVDGFAVLEKAILEVDELSRETEAMKDLMQVKQQEVESLKIYSSEMHEKRALIDNKLAALKSSLLNFSSSANFFEHWEAKARARVEASMSFLEQKAANLAYVQIQHDVINAKKREAQERETELRNMHLGLKSRLEKETRKLESERVLFAIDNVVKAENPPLQNIWKVGSKATELLKCEEEKTKLQNEIKQSRENLGLIKKEIEQLNNNIQKVDNEIHIATLDMIKATKHVEEAELALQKVIHEKELLLETADNGKIETDTLIAEYQMSTIEEYMKEEELKILEEDMHMASMKLEAAQKERAASLKRLTKLLVKQTGLPSQKLQKELEDLRNSILEISSLLGGEDSTDSQDILFVSPCRVSS
ncbi:hypothetical protein Cgig2_015935 [Carnegiea gigantea]|uniref:Kinesin motor domain-containing protein n=1 Tax=Carnegiea gigantea TaxID=171969 RepID=A0A9Q1KMB2_9CARY|nr:hypothetical protein Cgig2_015935 [Carnegiea gigantea]